MNNLQRRNDDQPTTTVIIAEIRVVSGKTHQKRRKGGKGTLVLFVSENALLPDLQVRLEA